MYSNKRTYNNTNRRDLNKYNYYGYLKDNDRCLLDNETLSDSSVIIRQDAEQYGEEFRFFVHCKNIRDLINYLATQRDNYLVHEIIFGDRGHKLFFDIDMKISNDITKKDFNTLLEQIVIGSMQVFEIHKSPLQNVNDIIVCTSHGDDKLSGHIIFRTKAVMSHFESKGFAFEVAEYVSEKYKKYIDFGVYKSLFSLRTLGSIKETRRKIIKSNWNFKGKKIKYKFSSEFDEISNDDEDNESMKNYFYYYETLIGKTIGCDFVSGFYVAPVKLLNESNILTENEGQNLFEMYCEYILDTDNLDPADCYTYRGVKDNYIILNRIRGEKIMCKVHGIEHENENPYIYVIVIRDENFSDFKLFFDCRRRYSEKEETNIYIATFRNITDNDLNVKKIEETDDLLKYRRKDQDEETEWIVVPILTDNEIKICEDYFQFEDDDSDSESEDIPIIEINIENYTYNRNPSIVLSQEDKLLIKLSSSQLINNKVIKNSTINSKSPDEIIEIWTSSKNKDNSEKIKKKNVIDKSEFSISLKEEKFNTKLSDSKVVNTKVKQNESKQNDSKSKTEISNNNRSNTKLSNNFLVNPEKKWKTAKATSSSVGDKPESTTCLSLSQLLKKVDY